MTDAKEVEVIEKTLGMMVYADGSARPNPGYSGFGIHGYLFEEVEPTRGTGNPDYIPTAGDYMSKAEKAANPDIPAVTIHKYIDVYGSFKESRTNNYAELMAVITAFKLALEQKVVILNLWTDSEYVVGGSRHMLKWKANHWLKPDGNPPASVQLWKEFDQLLTQLKENKVKLKITWCKGHSGIFGNELADGLAYIGMRQATHGVEEVVVELAEPQGYWKYDNSRHPFFNHRRMYFNSDSAYTTKGEYYFGEEGGDKEDDLRGKRASDYAFSLIRLAQPDDLLEMLRNHISDLAENRNAIMLMRMDYLYKASVHETITKYGTVPLRRRGEGLDIVFDDDKEPIATEKEPPLIIQRAVNAISDLSVTLSHYLDKSPDLVETDLTTLIYETVTEKKKAGEVSLNKLRSQFIPGYNVMTAPVNYRRPDGSLDVTEVKLSLGLDLLDRNSLKRLEETNPIVTLVTWSEGNQSFRYATIIRSGEDIGIWAAVHSNLRIILPK